MLTNARFVRVAAVHLVLLVRLRRIAGLVKLHCSINFVCERQVRAVSGQAYWAESRLSLRPRCDRAVSAGADIQMILKPGVVLNRRKAALCH